MGKDGGVVKIDLWTSDCSEENDIKLLMPTKIENKKALLTTWTVGEKVNEIMEWQLEEQGIKFEFSCIIDILYGGENSIW